jgi:hypothetical protein
MRSDPPMLSISDLIAVWVGQYLTPACQTGACLPTGRGLPTLAGVHVARCAVGETCVVDSARKEVSVDAEISWVPGWSEGRGPLADQGAWGIWPRAAGKTPPRFFWHILGERGSRGPLAVVSKNVVQEIRQGSPLG